MAGEYGIQLCVVYDPLYEKPPIAYTNTRILAHKVTRKDFCFVKNISKFIISMGFSSQFIASDFFRDSFTSWNYSGLCFTYNFGVHFADRNNRLQMLYWQNSLLQKEEANVS